MHQRLSTAALQPASGLQIRTLHLKILQDTYRPVSYTHLDVYKRQATWQADTLAVFVKVIFLFGLRRPRAALVKGAHGKHNMTMGVAAVGVCLLYTSKVSGRNEDFFFFQPAGDLIRTVAVNRHGKDALDHLGGFGAVSYTHLGCVIPV